jgi:hypothetical protein
MRVTSKCDLLYAQGDISRSPRCSNKQTTIQGMCRTQRTASISVGQTEVRESRFYIVPNWLLDTGT